MSVAKSQADAARYKAQQDWLKELLHLKESKDPAGIYLLNALLQGGYAPLMNASGKVSFPLGIGFSGSWSSYPVPRANSFSGGGSPIDSYDPSNVHLGQPHK